MSYSEMGGFWGRLTGGQNACRKCREGKNEHPISFTTTDACPTARSSTPPSPTQRIDNICRETTLCEIFPHLWSFLPLFVALLNGNIVPPELASQARCRHVPQRVP